MECQPEIPLLICSNAPAHRSSAHFHSKFIGTMRGGWDTNGKPKPAPCRSIHRLVPALMPVRLTIGMVSEMLERLLLTTHRYRSTEYCSSLCDALQLNFGFCCFSNEIKRDYDAEIAWFSLSSLSQAQHWPCSYRNKYWTLQRIHSWILYSTLSFVCLKHEHALSLHKNGKAFGEW